MTTRNDSRRQVKNWQGVLWQSLITSLLSSLAFSSALAATPEYAVKAAFIEKLTHFVDWPANSQLSDPQHVFKLCVIGKNPFGGSLQKLAGLTKIKGKEIVFLNISVSQDIQGCDLLFVSNRSHQPVSEILAETKNLPVLSISDIPGFAQSGGLVNFYTDKGRLRFEVNLGKAKAAGFIINPRFLKLARIVNKERGMR